MTVHTLPHGTSMAAAFASATKSNLFTFDLFETVKDIKHRGFSERLLAKIAFACDAYIGITIQRAISAMKDAHELAGTATWDSYQAFRNYVEGIAASEETMREAGMDVRDTRGQLQMLWNMRCACHDQIATIRGATPMDAMLVGPKDKKDPLVYAVPNIEQFMRNPRLRQDDASTTAKKKHMLKDMASDDDGVVDVQLLSDLERSYEIKSHNKKLNNLRFDKERGEMSAMLWRAFNLSDYGSVTEAFARVVKTKAGYVQEPNESGLKAHVAGDGGTKVSAAELVDRAMAKDESEGQDITLTEVDPFGDLDAMTQYRLMHGMLGANGKLGYIKSTLMEAADDWNVDFEEHAKWVYEARPLRKAIAEAVEHKKFADISL